MTSSSEIKDYIVAVQAPAYPVAPGVFATESAFAIHLKELRTSLGADFRKIVLIAPKLTDQQYEAMKDRLGTVSADEDGIEFCPAHETSASSSQFWRHEAKRLWRKMDELLPRAAIVHSGMADNIRRPMLGVVNLAAWRRKCPLMFIIDIDFRENTARKYKLGVWSLKQYLTNRLFHDPLRWIQVWFASRQFELVLLKSASMVRDFGRGRPNVKNFYDTVHSTAHMLSSAELESHLERSRDPNEPLRVIYFGRFVPYKGLSHTIEAVRQARSMGRDVRLRLIGDGECRAELQQQVSSAELNGAVEFIPPTPYGSALFDLLGESHLMMATPLSEDTPRAAFDAMARGLPILAFGINYFRDLAEESGAVAVVDWPDTQALAKKLVELSLDRQRVAEMARRGLAFAAANTQAIWLERRANWVREMLRRSTAQPRGGSGKSASATV